MQLERLISPDACFVGLSANSRRHLVTLAADAISTVAHISRDEVQRLLVEREKLGSTAIGAGCAIPHARSALVDRPVMVLLALAKPIEFDAADEAPVDLVAALLAPVADPRQTLMILARLARTFRSEECRQKLRGARSDVELYEVFASGFAMATPAL